MAAGIKSDEYFYIKEFDSDPEMIEIEGFELAIPLPKKPSKKHFKNYGKQIKDQKFKKEFIPPDLRYWAKRDLDAFVSLMWHKRKNGEWWLIGGKEVYVPGKAWMFLNFWYTQKGPLPDFRMEVIDFFTVWDFAEEDPNCYGIVDIKPRRIGDTEKTLFLVWEHCSRVKYQRGGMQNVKDDAAEKNFKRLVKGNKKMIWFFRPTIKGSDTPSKILEFTYPEQKVTRKKLKEAARKNAGGTKVVDNEYKFNPIESSIDYEASIQGRYDGEQLGIYHLDEPGKITAFDIKDQWPVIRRALSLNNDRLIVGKAIFTTTVEDYQKGSKSGESLSTLKNIEYFWKNSDPTKRDGNGRTITGLYRYFRNCVLSDETDEFGFYNRAKTIEWVMNTRQSLEDISDWDRLSQVKRQYPITIQDVFTVSMDDCVLMPILLDRRKTQIEDGLTWNNKVDPDGYIKPKTVVGDLIWEGGAFGGLVEFYPNPNGRFVISQFPTKRNFKIIVSDNIVKPGNDDTYTFGVDPYDHMVEGKAGEDGSPIHSKGAGIVYRKYSELLDGQLEKDEDGRIKESEVHKMKSDTFVLSYAHRPQDPHEFYEDMLKISLYYGVAMFYEKDKPGVGNFFRANKLPTGQTFGTFLKTRPKETKTAYSAKKEKGVKASVPIIQMYVDSLKWHVIHRIHNYHHLDILDDFRKFKVHNRTECDITVAAGMALLAAGQISIQRVVENKKQMSNNVAFFRKHKFNR